MDLELLELFRTLSYKNWKMTEYHEYHPGDRVKIVGLNSKPELNETMATVKKWDWKNERWKVELDALDGKAQLMKPSNLWHANDMTAKHK